jgi:hypothetical protein
MPPQQMLERRRGFLRDGVQCVRLEPEPGQRSRHIRGQRNEQPDGEQTEKHYTLHAGTDSGVIDLHETTLEVDELKRQGLSIRAIIRLTGYDPARAPAPAGHVANHFNSSPDRSSRPLLIQVFIREGRAAAFLH